MSDRFLRRKWTVRAHGQQLVLVKGAQEKPEHVWMKALLWALYLPDFPDLKVEQRIGDRYKPDVVALGAQGEPRFWGEAGQVGRDKLHSLARRFPQAHLAIAKWAVRLEPVVSLVEGAIAGLPRRAPVDVIVFPAQSVAHFFDEQGEVRPRWELLSWQRLPPES